MCRKAGRSGTGEDWRKDPWADKKPLPYTKKAHRASKCTFYTGIAQKGFPCQWRASGWFYSGPWRLIKSVLLMTAWGPQSSVPSLWDRLRSDRKVGWALAQVQTMCYKLWELCLSGSGHHHLFVDKFVSSGEPKNENQHHSLHLRNKYIGLILIFKKDVSVVFVWKNKTHCISCTKRNIQSIQVLFLESSQLDFLFFNRMFLWYLTYFLFFEIPVLLLLLEK